MGIQNSHRQGVLYDFSAALQMQLLHHASAIGFHCLDAEKQSFGDFLVGQAVGQQLQHLTFAVADALAFGTRGAFTVQFCLQCRVDVLVSLRQLADGGNQLLVHSALEQVAVTAGSLRCSQVSRVAVHGEHEHPHVRASLPQRC